MKIKSVFGVAAAVAVVGASVASTAVSAWGDSANGRTVYTLDQINSGVLGDKIVFNSITNSTFGDERNFVHARELNTSNVWSSNEISVEDGKTYVLSLYVHNNNPNGLNAVAKDVTTTFSVPSDSGTELKVTGYITASNATPNKYWDSVVFKSSSKFHLEYVSGSALWENNGIGANGGVQLSDNIIKTGGVKVGYSSLNGEIPGCYQYDGYASIEVKVVYDKEYTVDKRVRLAGASTWAESVDANIGDEVEFIIYYKNNSGKTAKNVMIKDVLPKNMEYVEGSTMLYNANHKDGIKNDDDTITTTGINIGNYDADTNAYVIFKAKVVDNALACGANKLVNWGQIGVGTTTLQDDASVNVNKTCTTPKKSEEIPNTGAGSIVAGVLGAGSITTAAGYYVASRKQLR